MATRYPRQNSRSKPYSRYSPDFHYNDRQTNQAQDWNDARPGKGGRNGCNSRFAQGRYTPGKGSRPQKAGYREDPCFFQKEGRRDYMLRGAKPLVVRNKTRNSASSSKMKNIQTSEPADPSTFIDAHGVLEMHPKGFGFLRNPDENYARLPADTFVPATLIDKMNLREGVEITGKAQPGDEDKGSRLEVVETINGLTLEDYAKTQPFDEKTPINPENWLRLSTGREPISTRAIDLLAPLGKGQRSLIVAPPRSGKTVLLQQISQAIITNYPEIHVIVLLIDERPEEVTDFRRQVGRPDRKNVEIVASTLDNNLESHVRIAQLISERCKRLTESGKDVFLLLDSITRLARAFNKWVGNTGRTMSGGIDIKAMDIPKRIFSSARMCEGSGSLTIIGTALVDTGSRMDELIFQEFKGTGNMELVLDRRLAERRIWPALDISKSGTRREEKLLPPDILRAVNIIRRVLIPMNPAEAMEKLVRELSRYENNEEFFKQFIRHE